MDIDAGPKVMGDDGEFHVVDEAVDLSRHAGRRLGRAGRCSGCWARWCSTQFFTRYVLNNSASWTEEIARYLLIGAVFVGAAIGVAKNNHIQVDLLYRYLPQRAGRVLVDRGGPDAHRLLRRDDGVHRADDGQAAGHCR